MAGKFKKNLHQRRLMVLISIVFVVCVTSAGASAPSKGVVKIEADVENKGGVSNIVFEKMVHDFGQVAPETKNVYEFKFTNDGNTPVKIEKVRVSCPKCTVAKADAKEYAPGQSGVIKVTYTADKRPGVKKYSVYVSSDEATSPKIVLGIKVNIVPKVACEPMKLKLSLKNENAGCPKIKIYSTDGQEFSISDFRSIPTCISPGIDPTKKATEFILQPKVDMDKLRKVLKGRIEFRLTHPESKMVTVGFGAPAEFKISPATIIAFNMERGKAVKRELWVLSNYDEDFEIESTSSENGFVKVLKKTREGKRYKFQLEIMPPKDRKIKVVRDVFTVNIKGGKKLEVNVRGNFKKKK